MKRKIALICVMVMLMTVFAQSASAVNVIMNSSFLKFSDQEPVIKDGTTLVPIRDIAEALGLLVTWDDPSDTVTLKKDNFFIEMVIGSTKIKTVAGEKTAPGAPEIINGRTMVPLRFIAEEMGLNVFWNEQYQRVVINGQVDTQKVYVPEEKSTDVDMAEEKVDTSLEEEAPTEEETVIEEDVLYNTVQADSTSIMFEIPANFYPEDVESEESFAYKTLDATDVQHKYNWEKVTIHESYADQSGINGIVYVVSALDPYTGEEYDISNMNKEYPSAPERPQRPQFPQIDMTKFTEEYTLAILKQMFIDMDVEVPENLEELDEEEIKALLGFESDEEMQEQINISKENADFSSVTGYEEYQAYQEEYQIYNEEMVIYWEEQQAYLTEALAIEAVKNYAIRKFQEVYKNATEEEWVKLFDSRLNVDEEVVYDGVEILDINGKKIVHALVLAQDPDDEQGVFEFYYYIDGDSEVTIFGGTLYGSEASLQASEALANMIIK
ncbi:MAG: copper amine oxidase N-terminal domain-containing protein [Clostridia bacterium]